MTADERRRAQEIAAGLKKPTKYRNKPVACDGLTFASGREARRWSELKLLHAAGEIHGLERQVAIVLQGQNGPILTPTGRPMKYVADFVYFDVRLGKKVIEDAKGYPTPEYRLKRAILAAMGMEIVEV